MKNSLFIALFLFACNHSEKKLYEGKSPREMAKEFCKQHAHFNLDTTNEVFIANKYFAVLTSQNCFVGDCETNESPILLGLIRKKGRWKLDFISKNAIPNPTDFQDYPFQKIKKINENVLVLSYNFGTVIENFHEFYFNISDKEKKLIKVRMNLHDWNTNFDTVIIKQNENISLEHFDFLGYVKN
jgi:hypothetical protein